jgi:hypothetical protein
VRGGARFRDHRSLHVRGIPVLPGTLLHGSHTNAHAVHVPRAAWAVELQHCLPLPKGSRAADGVGARSGSSQRKWDRISANRRSASRLKH